MKRTILWTGIIILCLVAWSFEIAFVAGKPNITRHEANYLENAVNMHIEWQSPNAVTLVKVSMPNVDKEFPIDPYDNKRNPDGYSGEIDVTLNIGGVSSQSFTYVVQLQDELRIKSEPATGYVKIASSQQTSVVVPQIQQPGLQIDIQQNIAGQQTIGQQMQGQSGAQTAGQPVGSVIVVIDPPQATAAGGMWRVGNEPWKKGGEMISNLPAGTYQTIEFQDVNNWIKPDNQIVVIEAGQSLTLYGTYQSK